MNDDGGEVVLSLRLSMYAKKVYTHVRTTHE
jgi:hypothetical protein